MKGGFDALPSYFQLACPGGASFHERPKPIYVPATAPERQGQDRLSKPHWLAEGTTVPCDGNLRAFNRHHAFVALHSEGHGESPCRQIRVIRASRNDARGSRCAYGAERRAVVLEVPFVGESVGSKIGRAFAERNRRASFARIWPTDASGRRWIRSCRIRWYQIRSGCLGCCTCWSERRR